MFVTVWQKSNRDTRWRAFASGKIKSCCGILQAPESLWMLRLRVDLHNGPDASPMEENGKNPCNFSGTRGAAESSATTLVCMGYAGTQPLAGLYPTVAFLLPQKTELINHMRKKSPAAREKSACAESVESKTFPIPSDLCLGEEGMGKKLGNYDAAWMGGFLHDHSESRDW